MKKPFAFNKRDSLDFLMASFLATSAALVFLEVTPVSKELISLVLAVLALRHLAAWLKN